MATWTSPLKQKKVKAPKEEDPLKDFKKEKPKVSSGAAKSIVGSSEAVGQAVAYWTERWIDNYVRSYGLPPQLVSNDFIALLGRYLPPKDALEILNRLRTDYCRDFSLTHAKAKDDFDPDTLPGIVQADPVATELLRALLISAP